jgi:DNA-binding transcriptional regulator LsrR (DeoR family)
MAVLTLSDAAKALGHRSRSTLYRLLNQGRLDDFVRHQSGKRMLEVDGLAAAVKNQIQHRRSSIVLVQDIAPTDWTRVARVCNSYLGEHWGPPPWSKQQWFVLWDSLQDALAGWPEAIEGDEAGCGD